DFLQHLARAIEDRELLELRSARRRKRQETLAVGADVRHAYGNVGWIPEEDSGFGERKRLRRVDVGDHDRAITRHLVQLLSVAVPEPRAEAAVGNLPGPAGHFRIDGPNEDVPAIRLIDDRVGEEAAVG